MWSGRRECGMFAEAAIACRRKELAARHATEGVGCGLHNGRFAQEGLWGLVGQ